MGRPPEHEALVGSLSRRLQAFADAMVPGRRVAATDLGNEIDPRAIAGVDPLPGAVEADTLALYRPRTWASA